jgi:long-chain acyl-CoA synthetase
MTDTLYDAFLETANRYPQRTALMVKKQGRYTAMTYRQLAKQVNAVARNLAEMGLGKRDAIAILSSNRPEWVMADLAALKLGAVVVPIYPSSSPGTVRYIIQDSNAQLLIVENTDLFTAISSALGEIGRPLKGIIIDAVEADVRPELMLFSRLLASVNENAVEEPVISPQDIATIVYTSGTTGEPKGVVLTHANIRSNVQAMVSRYQISAADTFLSYLPLCHMFERTCGYYAILFSGGVIAYAENTATVAADVLAVRPTVLLAVPRVIEKAFEHAVHEVSQNSRVKRRLVSFTITSLNERADLRYRGQRVPLGLRLRCFVLDKTIAAKFRKIGGGRLRIIASGGAPLDRKIAKTYYVLGYNLVEGYGMTEASPVICSSSVLDNILGTVGKPVPGVEVRIGENEEIIVRGPSVMQGYLNKPGETARVIDQDGWLHTEDQGRFDARGNLIITGRIKDLIVTSYGKKVAAAAIEAKIAGSPYISQVMVYGDRRKYLTALVVPMRKTVERYAADEGISADSYESLLKDTRIRARIAAEIEEATKDCAPYEKVKEFALIAEEFTIESGLLTPLLKLRRKLVAERYCSTIESLYETAEGKQ